MLGQQKFKSISSVCYALLLVSAALHIAYGFEFLNLGSFRNKTTGNQQLYQDAVPLAIFTITFGIFLAVSALCCWYCRARMHHLEKRGQIFLWIAHWIIAAFTFAAGVMTVRQYTREVQFYSIFGQSLPANSQFQIPLYLSLVDGIYTFVIGFPATLILVYFGNIQMVQTQRKNMLDIVASDAPEESSVEEEPPLSVTVSKHLTKNMGFEESREIQRAFVE